MHTNDGEHARSFIVVVIVGMLTQVPLCLAADLLLLQTQLIVRT